LSKSSKLTALLFAVSKYTEVAFLALMSYFVASRLGAVQYGQLSPYMVIVTYSAYFLLGVNQYVVKGVSVGNLSVDDAISRSIFYFIPGVIGMLVILGIFNNYQYKFLLILVVSLMLLRNISISIARVTNSMKILSIGNFVSAAVFLGLAYVYINSVSSYLIAWAFSISSSLLILIFCYRISYKTIKGTMNLSAHLTGLKESISFVLSGIITTYFLTAERTILIRMNAEDEMIGLYQFSDQVGLAIYIGISSLIFYFTPNIYKKFSIEKNFGKSENILFITITIIAPVISFAMALMCRYLFAQNLPEFVVTIVPIFQTVLSRILLSLLVLISMVMFAKNMQRYYILVCGAIILSFLFVSLIVNNYELLIYLNIGTLLIALIIFMCKLNNNYNYDI
jgi:O-antigen/teichoic acid export membrane protein